MVVLVGPVLLVLMLSSVACAVTAEVVALTSPQHRASLRRVLDPAAIALLAASVVLLVLRLRHYS